MLEDSAQGKWNPDLKVKSEGQWINICGGLKGLKKVGGPGSPHRWVLVGGPYNSKEEAQKFVAENKDKITRSTTSL